MKKLGYLLLAGLVAACLAACGSHSSSTSNGELSTTVENSAHQVSGDAQQGGPNSSTSDSSELSSMEESPNREEAVSVPQGESSVEEASQEESEDEVIMQQTTFYVSVGGETFSATFADNSGAQALKELLAEGDLTISMSDYSGFEKVGPLGQSLPTENIQTTTQAGDIVLYQGNQIVMFYGSNSWSYTRLGRIDDLTGWEEALGSGEVSVTLSLQGE